MVSLLHRATINKTDITYCILCILFLLVRITDAAIITNQVM